MSRDVPERPRDDIPHDPRPGSVGVRPAAAGLALIAAALIAGVLAGCGGGGGGTSVAGSTTVSTTQASTDSGPAANLSPKQQRELDRQLRQVTRIHRQLRPASSSVQIRVRVRAVLASTDPIACTRAAVTERYLNAAYGGHSGCIQSLRPGSVAKSISFESLRIGSDRATAVVVPTGGPYDGERITVSLVRDPRWAVDQLKSNVPVGP